MRKKSRKYTAGEIGRVRPVEDFLPSAEALTPAEGSATVITRHTDAELRAMAKRGESKSDWKAAAKKPLPSGADPDDAMDDDNIEGQASWPTSRKDN